MSTVTPPWWRPFAPTIPTEPREPGFVHTPSGRRVYDTGRVLIGQRYEPTRSAMRDPGPHAEALQASLLEHRRHAIHDARPRVSGKLFDGMCWAAAITAIGGFLVWVFMGAPRFWS